MKTIFILATLLLLSGCIEQRMMVSNRQNFEFDNRNDTIQNEQHCYMLCKAREDGRYRCDYEPVICSNGKCLCKTY